MSAVAEELTAEGYDVKTQMAPRAIGVLEGFTASINPIARPTLPSDTAAAEPALLAHHFTLGRVPGRALGHVLQAQEWAERDHRWDYAIRYCRQALDLTRQTNEADLVLQIELL